MDTKLRYVEIKKLFGQYDVEWNIDRDTTVLVGQNGSGKTTILSVIISLLMKDSRNNFFEKSRGLFDSSLLRFSNNGEIHTDHSGKIKGEIPAILVIDVIKEALNVAVNEKDIEKSNHYKLLLESIENNSVQNIAVRSDGKARMNFFSDESLRNINVEFISTLNLSANALNNVAIGDGTDLNVLDIQIERAITSFQKLKEQESYSEIKAKVISVLNDFFSTTQKTITLSDTEFSIENAKKESLKLSQLSAGERQIIYIVFKVSTAYFNEALILMDEPEISLHLEWQEKLLKNLREINDKSQMIVVTHSPAIIMDGWMDSYVDIQTILKPIKDDE